MICGYLKIVFKCTHAIKSLPQSCFKLGEMLHMKIQGGSVSCSSVRGRWISKRKKFCPKLFSPHLPYLLLSIDFTMPVEISRFNLLSSEIRFWVFKYGFNLTVIICSVMYKWVFQEKGNLYFSCHWNFMLH